VSALNAEPKAEEGNLRQCAAQELKLQRRGRTAPVICSQVGRQAMRAPFAGAVLFSQRLESLRFPATNQRTGDK
jgi:hypothetical protein